MKRGPFWALFLVRRSIRASPQRAFVAGAAGDPQAVEVFEQRLRVLAARPEQIARLCERDGAVLFDVCAYLCGHRVERRCLEHDAVAGIDDGAGLDEVRDQGWVERCIVATGPCIERR